MASKRVISDSPSAADEERGRKRQRTGSTSPASDKSISGDTTAPAPSPVVATGEKKLSAGEKKKLASWLVRAWTKRDGGVFPIHYIREDQLNGKLGKGKTKTRGKRVPKAAETLTLELHGRKYGEVTFAIGNKPKWDMMTKFRRCTVGLVTFMTGDCVLIRSDEDDDEEDSQDSFDTDNTRSQWKAQIHEMRALDEHHVYLLVSWLYRPDKDLKGGPKGYHGYNELIPSTDLCIIDAKTINGMLDIKYLDEGSDDTTHDGSGYFWRQAYDFSEAELSNCRRMCRCNAPENPDLPIIQCTQCHQWQHSGCLVEDALYRYAKSIQPGDEAVDAESTIAVVNGDHPRLTREGSSKKAVDQTELSRDMSDASPEEWNEKLERDGLTASVQVDPSSRKVSVTVFDKEGKMLEVMKDLFCLCCRKPIDG